MGRNYLLVCILCLVFGLPLASAKSTILFNESFSSNNGKNWTFDECEINAGKMACESNEAAIFIHKLPDISTNTNSWTMELYDFNVHFNGYAFPSFFLNRVKDMTTNAGDNVFSYSRKGFTSQSQICEGVNAECIDTVRGENTNTIKIITLLNESIDVYVNGIYIGNIANTKNPEYNLGNWSYFILGRSDGESPSNTVSISGIAVYNGTKPDDGSNIPKPSFMLRIKQFIIGFLERIIGWLS